MLSSGFFGSFSYRATVALKSAICFSNASCALGSVTALFCASRAAAAVSTTVERIRLA